MEGTGRYFLLILLFCFYTGNGQNTAVRRCDVPADVVFLMDASDSITDVQWEQEKNFVSDLIDSLEVERTAIHVGVIVYSTNIGLVIDLQPFKNKTQLKLSLQDAVHLNGGTDTGKAIARLIDMSDGQGRIEIDAKQIAVIITDGRSTNVPALRYQAPRARNEFGIDFIAVGVGNETFRGELEQIVGPDNQNGLFQVGSFEQLSEVVQQLQDIICEFVPTVATTTTLAPTTTQTTIPTTSPNVPQFPCNDPADVIFLIDGSYSIKPPDWHQGKQFVSYVINSLNITGENTINVGIIVYGTEIGDVVPLRDYKNKEILRTLTAGLVQPDVGATNTALGLNRLREMLRAESRPGVPHIAIVITDGVSTDESETRLQASLAKAEGITIFVVGIGNDVERRELEDMSSAPQMVFDAPNFQYLVRIVEQLRDNVCSAIKTTPPPPTTTTVAPTIPDLCLQCLEEHGVGFNPYPPDCEKYVMCVPQGQTYDPVIRSCPFGLFWSNKAVSCLDSRYVTCPNDRCLSMMAGQSYGSSSGNCRSYFRCSNSGRSSPVCCQSGFRYIQGFGCTYDPSCRDPCPLEVTINNEGACKFRPDPNSYYSYYEVIPGSGQSRRSCDPGQVYSSKMCACTYDAASVVPELACSATVHIGFNGSFEDTSHHQQPIDVRGVTLSSSGSAYFDGIGYISLPGTVNLLLKDTFVIKLRFRRRGKSSGQTWNKNWSWGFQTWYNNASRVNSSSLNMIVGSSPITARDTARPNGAIATPLEVITIAKDGTVIRDPRYEVKVDTSWPPANHKKVTVLNMGGLGKLTTPSIQNGIVYIPGSQERVLVQEPSIGVSGSTQSIWKVVKLNSNGKTGTVERTGEGAVPISIQQQFGFELRAPLRERWWVLAPGNMVLESGEGAMPPDIVNRYRGWTSGTLVKVFDRGQKIVRWRVSKPDETQLQFGNGEIPQRLRNQYNMEKFLGQAKVTAMTWAVLGADGKILEQGTGNFPESVKGRYSDDSSVTVLTLSSQDGGVAYWRLMRTSGVTLLEEQGLLPDGISGFVKGRLRLPQISQVREWRVTLPDGTVRTGTGEIPQSIKDLFNVTLVSTPVKIFPPAGSDKISHWTVTLPDGSVNKGVGVIPPEVLALLPGARYGGIQAKWQIVMPDGSIRKGSGTLPSDLGALAMTSSSSFNFGTKSASSGKRRKRRQAMMGSNTRVMDLLSNCGATSLQSPSLHMYTGSRDVSMTVVTSNRQAGVTVSVPVHQGMNDVMFIYNGHQLTGNVNGYVASKRLSGHVLSKPSPITLGRCLFRNNNHFVGEIDSFEMYNCLP